MLGYIRRFMFLSAIVGAVCVGSTPAAGQYPGQLYHQGVIAVHGERFTGEGDFRFALVDRDTDAYLWVNDGSGVATAEPPTNPVTLTVVNGIYNVRLGDTDLANMTAIPRAVFNEDNVVLRIWFDDGINGVYRLTPDQVLTSVPYAQRLPNVFVDEDTGNVGIGTTTPDNALSVDGDADVSGSLGIGTTTPANELSVAGNADFSGNVGLGTGSPRNKLDVGGGAVVGSGYAGTTSGPPNGLLVQGNVGIGTKTPQNELDVEGSAVVGSSYSGLTTAPADSLLVEGSIGIGTSSPQNKLDVEGGAVVGYAYSGTETAPSNGLLVEGNVGIGTNSPGFRLTVQGNEAGSVAQWLGLKNLDGETKWHVNNKDGGLNFAETGVEDGRLFLKQGGNVGIGTTQPQQQLSVDGGLNIDQGDLNKGNDRLQAIDPALRFGSNSGEAIASNRTATGQEPHWGLDFYTNHWKRMSILNNGNVGIGTDEPQGKLDVNGDIRINGSKPFLFKTVSCPGGCSADTGIGADDYVCAITGFKAHGGDIWESGSYGDIIRAYIRTDSDSWVIHTDFRSHVEHEAWRVDVMCVLRNLAEGDYTGG